MGIRLSGTVSEHWKLFGTGKPFSCSLSNGLCITAFCSFAKNLPIEQTFFFFFLLYTSYSMDACYNLMGEWRQLKCHNISVGGFKTGPWRLYRRNWEKPFSSSCIWYVCVFWVWERDRRREREEEEGKKGRGEKVLMNSPTFSCHLQLQAFLFILLFF